MVAEFKQPNYNTQTGTEYPLAIDASIAVHHRLAGPFAAHAQTAPNMTVRVDAGALLNGITLTEVAAQNTGTIAAPVGNPRIDRVVVDAVTGAVSVITGTPAGSPVAPAIADGKLPVAQVLLQTSSTTIANSMITDERVPLATKITAFAATLLDDASNTDARTTLGLGTAAVVADNTLVHLAGAETITGDKKHTGSNSFQTRVNTAVNVGGTVNDITCSFDPPIHTGAGGVLDQVRATVRATGANTGAVKLDYGLGLVSVEKIVGGTRQVLAAGDITGAMHNLDLMWYAPDGRWILLNPKPVVDLLTQYFEYVTSANVAGTIETAHGLGAAPVLRQFFLRCTDAAGDASYAQNDEVNFTCSAGPDALPGYANATNIGVAMTGTVYVVRKNASDVPAIVKSKWNLVMRAWK